MPTIKVSAICRPNASDPIDFQNIWEFINVVVIARFFQVLYAHVSRGTIQYMKEVTVFMSSPLQIFCSNTVHTH